MSGHSKWANIQHRKGRQDKKRGKLFTKLIRELTVAARIGGSDADANPQLRVAIDKALNGNMPKDTIAKAIKRGAGELEGEHYEEVRYEGYGPGGAAVMVDCMTDNRNRTVSEIRRVFSKCGGNLGTDGSVAYMFTKTGVLTYPPGSNEDAIMETAIEAGAEDIVTNDDGSIDVLTRPDDFMKIKDSMLEANLQAALAEVTMRASSNCELKRSDAEKILRLLDMLDDLDDVQNIYTNADIPDEILSEVS